MNSEKVVIKCWSCKEKFTISAAGDRSILIFKSPESSIRSAHEKERMLKTCPYCGKENEVEL
ncbi:MAG TPA: hypothetical protein VJJ51_06710 [Candidatus Methanoperedens sp.]|nr:hypothetical protein [Candidatus Methanoperedens sp.]HLB70719.1 hypothetical protein [Candidatus Methanoperedens sp.]